MPIVPLVAIEIPADVAPDLASVVLRTCNLALGSGRCALVDATLTASNASWLAHVGTDPTQTSLLRIELRDALPRELRTTYSRSLSFEDTDAPEHRWSTVGVVVAALVISAETGKRAGSGVASNTEDGSVTGDANDADTESTVAASSSTKSSRRSRKALPRGSESNGDSTRSSSSRALRLDLVGIAGPGIEAHAGRYGLALRPSIELAPNVGLWLEAAGSRAEDSITVSWWSGAAGLGFVADILPRRFAMEARIAIIGDRIVINATDEAGDSDSAGRWRWGAGAGLDAVLLLADSFGLFIGADARLASPRVKIRQAGTEVGQSPTVEALFSAGLRWRIPFGR